MQETVNDYRQVDRMKADVHEALAANVVDTWIGKAPHRVLYHCPRSQTRISRAVIQKTDYQHEYFFILDNGLNQPVHGSHTF
jgi:hypothetical protein